MSEPLSQAHREAYERDGYVVVAGLYDRGDGERVRRLAFRSVLRFVPSLAAAANEAEPWHSDSFEQAVRRMYAEDRDTFNAFQDMLQNAALLRELASAPRTLRAVASLLNEESDGLALSGVQLRVDVPNDPHNTHAFHQERAYYAQNTDGARGLVMSIAVQDTPADQGALRVCPGSHRGGLIPHDTPQGADGQQNLPAHALERYAVASADYRQGEVLFVHMNTFHQAGKNLSQRVRYTVLCRYHQMLADPAYVATRARLEPNPLLLKRAQTRLGRDSDGPATISRSARLGRLKTD
jgi:ectoine hydroxylase-related dioxygenase (phytanoyl-CoA dioxygenase family)